MDLQFDHGVIAVADLQHAIRVFRDTLGLDARYGGRHGGRGTENAIIRFRDDYIELLSLFDPDKEVAVSGVRGRVLADFIEQHAGGLVGFCLKADDIFGHVEQLRRANYDVQEPLSVSRTLPSGHVLRWRVLLIEGINWRRPWPFLIHADPANAAFRADEPVSDHPLGVTRVAGVAVIVADLTRGKQLYGQHLGLRLAGEDQVPALGAVRARFVHGDLSVDLLTPTGEGPVRDQLTSSGEGVFQILLRIGSRSQAEAWLARSGIALQPAPGYPDGVLIPPDRAVGARLVLTESA